MAKKIFVPDASYYSLLKGANSSNPTIQVSIGQLIDSESGDVKPALASLRLNLLDPMTKQPLASKVSRAEDAIALLLAHPSIVVKWKVPSIGVDDNVLSFKPDMFAERAAVFICHKFNLKYPQLATTSKGKEYVVDYMAHLAAFDGLTPNPDLFPAPIVPQEETKINMNVPDVSGRAEMGKSKKKQTV